MRGAEAGSPTQEDLRARIAELEAELAAKPAVDRATLYRLADNAPWGVLAVNSEGRLDFANSAMQRWLNSPVPATGLVLVDTAAPSLMNVLEPLVAAGCRGETAQLERHIPDIRGELRHVQIGVTPRSVGPQGLSGCVVQVSDVTDANALDASLRENEARLRLAMDAGHMAVWEYEVSSGRLVAGHQLARLLGYPADAAPTSEEMRAGYDADDWDRMTRTAQQNLADGSHAVESELRHRVPDGVERTLLLRLEMLRDEAGQVVKGHGVLVDITERKKAEAARILLVNELNHRVKNTLAVVQSMARLTLREPGDPASAWRDFNDRLASLAETYDLLTAENWASAELGRVIAHAAALTGGRLTASGPKVHLSPKLALSLSMAFHELLTNAVKYGALAAAHGSVAVRWTVNNARLELRWIESGGAPVLPPVRRGFGTRLLEKALAADLDGSVTLDFAAQGLVCRIEAPLQLSRSEIRER